MFTNKRQLKNYIDRLGTEVAQSVLPAAVCAKLITDEKAEELLTDLSRIKAQAHSRLAISYDKAISDFANARQYAKERKAYFRTAYAKAIADYEQGIDNIIDTVNKAAKK